MLQSLEELNLSQSYIDIQEVSKTFGSVRAVDRVNLTIARGEFFSLLGPSGCGKTTLLRLLAGFEMPDEGQILIDSVEMSRVPPHQRPTNMVFQSYAIFPHLDVGSNVSYGLRRQKLSKSEKNKRVEDALAMVKLSGFERRRSTELSGGQRQRVALARALIMRPKVLLLDEPLGALDRKLREEMQVELRSLQKQVDITFVFVTHDQEEALTMSDKIAVMDQGAVLQVATPREIYEQPGSRKVAAFIGQMNFVESRASGVGESVVYLDSLLFKELEIVKPNAIINVGDKVIVAIRPESLCLTNYAVNDGVPVVLCHSSYYGQSTYCVVRPDGSNVKITVLINDLGGLEMRGNLWLSWKTNEFVLLES
jgi:spermidine/putrescine ABC transporter ATP-binding subunit